MNDALTFGDFIDYLVPDLKCPNCLETGETMRHWVHERWIDGVECGDWACEAKSDAELEAAGYLLNVTVGSESAQTSPRGNDD